MKANERKRAENQAVGLFAFRAGEERFLPGGSQPARNGYPLTIGLFATAVLSVFPSSRDRARRAFHFP
jgi:hypothetical protein